MARVRRHGRIWNSKGSRFISRRKRSWWCAWFLPTPATIRRNDGLEMGPSDRKSPFFTTILGIGSKFLPKNSSQQISPTPGAPSPSFWRAGSRARPTPSWLLFFWAAQKTGRSQAEKFRGELSPRPRDTAIRHSCVSWLSQPVAVSNCSQSVSDKSLQVRGLFSSFFL